MSSPWRSSGSKRRKQPGDPPSPESPDEFDDLMANLERTIEDLNNFDDVEEADEGITKRNVTTRFTVEEASEHETPEFGLEGGPDVQSDPREAYQVMPDVNSSSLDSIMRGGDGPPLIEPGRPAPVLFQLLLARLVSQVREAGLTPSKLTDRAVASFQAWSPRRPLEALSVEEKQDPVVHIDDAVHAFAGMSKYSTVRVFKSIVLAKALSSYEEALGRTHTDEEEALVSRRLDERLDPHISMIEWDFYLNADGVPQDIRDLVAGLDSGSLRDPLFMIADRFLTDHQPPPPREPNPEEKADLAQALEALPVVQKMYTLGALTMGSGSEGGSLSGIVARDESQKQPHFKKYVEAFYRNVREGMMIFASLVPERRRPPLQHTANVEIAVDKVEAGRFRLGTRVTQQRAEAARVGNKILLSVMDDVPTIVHEIGHQVEFYLPLTEWMRLQGILRMRMDGPLLIDIYPGAEKKEAALDVTAMPAFEHFYERSGQARVGKYYPARVYSSGDTELVSMTMQFFSQPETAQIMIRHDPLLAGTVLRAIRPDDFLPDRFPADMAALLPS